MPAGTFSRRCPRAAWQVAVRTQASGPCYVGSSCQTRLIWHGHGWACSGVAGLAGLSGSPKQTMKMKGKVLTSLSLLQRIAGKVTAQHHHQQAGHGRSQQVSSSSHQSAASLCGTVGGGVAAAGAPPHTHSADLWCVGCRVVVRVGCLWWC